MRDALKHVALVLVEGGDAARVGEEAVEPPLVEQDEHHGLRRRRRLEVGVGRVQVDHLEELLRARHEAEAHTCERASRQRISQRSALVLKREVP